MKVSIPVPLLEESDSQPPPSKRDRDVFCSMTDHEASPALLRHWQSSDVSSIASQCVAKDALLARRQAASTTATPLHARRPATLLLDYCPLCLTELAVGSIYQEQTLDRPQLATISGKELPVDIAGLKGSEESITWLQGV